VTRSTIVGIGAAVTATFVWSLNFIVPFVIEPYSIFDFALMRFAVAGLMCAAFVASRRHSVLTLTLQDWLVTFWLGVIGCVAYFFALVGAAMLAGAVIPQPLSGLSLWYLRSPVTFGGAYCLGGRLRSRWAS
jgi:drug/metabolite transporter (DMT)-like permease